MKSPLESFNDFDKQAILYSKGWYKVTNSMDDLRTVLSKMMWVPIECIPDSDVLQQVAATLHKIWKVKPADSHDMDCLYKDIWQDNLWNKKVTITPKDHLDAILRAIHMKDISHYPELPKPSADILPTDELERWDVIHAGYADVLSSLTSK